jgi:hypothetical protein
MRRGTKGQEQAGPHFYGARPLCKCSLTKPLVKAYSVRLGWPLGKRHLFGAFD